MIIAALTSLLLMKVAVVPLAESVKSTSQIVVGTVARVHTISGRRFADVMVERTIKGRSVGMIRFLAEPAWTCDSSGATVGERAVFLFEGQAKDSVWVRGRENSKGLPGLQEALRQAGSVALLDHSGSRKILIRKKLIVVRRVTPN